MSGNDTEGFMIDPSSIDEPIGAGFSNIPPTAEAAWILELIQIRLKEAPIEEKFKKELMEYMTPYLNLAGFTCITRGQVIEFWMGYQKLWTKYRIYINRDKFDPTVIFLKDWILEMFMMMLNKSIEGTQLKAVFERKHIYDVKQRNESAAERLKGYFRSKRKNVVEEG